MTRYSIFETAAGFCAIAWSESGVVRFQLPAKSAESAERRRRLLRRAPEATPGEPPAEISAAIAAAKRYFAGEETDFSGVRLDLGDKDPLFKQIYAAARRIGWGRTTTYGALAKDIGAGPEVARDVGTALAENPVPLIVPCPRVLAAGGKVEAFPRRAERRRKSACWNSRAFASPPLRRFSGPSRSERPSKRQRVCNVGRRTQPARRQR